MPKDAGFYECQVITVKFVLVLFPVCGKVIFSFFQTDNKFAIDRRGFIAKYELN